MADFNKTKLKLPTFEILVQDRKVRCLIRKKWVELTPEEWVRQHFLNLLVNHLGYPKGLIKLEQPLRYFKNSKRSDISILNRTQGLFMVVECKASQVYIDQEVVKQVSEYNKVLKASYMSVTNGINHFVWRYNDEGVKQLSTFPEYGDQ
ncbi:MAG: type I restriction enzyme HsdR N-terminal domain-containing protein [Bacteroidota bacterium]